MREFHFRQIDDHKLKKKKTVLCGCLSKSDERFEFWFTVRNALLKARSSIDQSLSSSRQIIGRGNRRKSGKISVCQNKLLKTENEKFESVATCVNFSLKFVYGPSLNYSLSSALQLLYTIEFIEYAQKSAQTPSKRPVDWICGVILAF